MPWEHYSCEGVFFPSRTPQTLPLLRLLMRIWPGATGPARPPLASGPKDKIGADATLADYRHPAWRELAAGWPSARPPSGFFLIVRTGMQPGLGPLHPCPR